MARCAQHHCGYARSKNGVKNCRRGHVSKSARWISCGETPGKSRRWSGMLKYILLALRSDARVGKQAGGAFPARCNRCLGLQDFGAERGSAGVVEN